MEKEKKIPFERFSKRILIIGKKKESFVRSLFEIEKFLKQSKKTAKIIELYKLLK